MKIEFAKAKQILNMGGPWIGDLMIDGKLISKDCLIDNYIIDSPNSKLYFVKYRSTTGMMNGVFFTINFFLFKEDKLFEYEKQFKILFIKQIMDGKMEIFEAFHDKLDKFKEYFDLVSEKFRIV